ncbi:hypothetical protein DEU56DRAFT_769025 [Suillus clintonianus]|uniref:uncharacterized protein n=1 Tax=Suillus clintonianus TaxID=1904413 RepID=UPI001B85C43F|nr:uncharacterized protein DEU56DRAFT_769025 [Suillus clintonianus]KAG2155755.1 hypothetical protein DEU56DRAFT_769025 [Suillus clintonianus]
MSIIPNPPRWQASADPASIDVPGLDTNASVNDQIDQIEQLITIKLQNIDTNFSKIQNIMATKLLPAVKRYAVSTEPVREAAKFWTSFYEKAAQVHIPTYDDYSSLHEQQSEATSQAESSSARPDAEETSQFDTEDDTTPSHPRNRTYDPNSTASESSFMPSNAVSSTPARTGFSGNDTVEDQPSWSASLESPLVRLDRELQNFTLGEDSKASAGQDDTYNSFAYEEENTVQQFTDKGKSRDYPHGQSVLQGASRPNLPSLRVPPSALPTPRGLPASARVSPLKVKPKTPVAIPQHLHAYLPPRNHPDPPLPSPRKRRYERSPHKPYPPLSSTSNSSSTLDIPSLTRPSDDSNRSFDQFNDSFDDSAELMRGLSPPRTVAFPRGPRSSVGLGLLPPLGRTPGKDLHHALGRTPGKEAAERIRRDLLGDVQSDHSSVRSSATVDRFGGFKKFGYSNPDGMEDTMSTIPTPPSITRYTRHAYPSGYSSNDPSASFASLMRRTGLGIPEYASTSKSHSVVSPQSLETARLAPPSQPQALHTPDPYPDLFHFQQGDPNTLQPDDQHPDSDSDSDSLGEPAHPGQPSTAFLMASARNQDPDDSFGSSNSNHSSDSIGGGFGDEGGAVHPFARAVEDEGDGFDDSFDSVDDDGQSLEVQEETVFGIPPAQRKHGRGPSELRLLGEDLLQDTIGIGSQLAKAGRVEESPTPYGR